MVCVSVTPPTFEVIVTVIALVPAGVTGGGGGFDLLPWCNPCSSFGAMDAKPVVLKTLTIGVGRRSVGGGRSDPARFHFFGFLPKESNHAVNDFV